MDSVINHEPIRPGLLALWLSKRRESRDLGIEQLASPVGTGGDAHFVEEWEAGSKRPTNVPPTATKASVIGMRRVWARDLERRGITVKAICPGFISIDRPMPCRRTSSRRC